MFPTSGTESLGRLIRYSAPWDNFTPGHLETSQIFPGTGNSVAKKYSQQLATLCWMGENLIPLTWTTPCWDMSQASFIS